MPKSNVLSTDEVDTTGSPNLGSSQYSGRGNHRNKLHYSTINANKETNL